MVANVRETEGALIHLGDPVEVRVLAFPDRVFTAKITFIAPSIDTILHRLPVWAEVENPDGILKPGMFASFRIITGDKTLSPAVPESAIVYEGETARVWVGDPATKTLAIRQIKSAGRTVTCVEVLDGLKPGDGLSRPGRSFIDRASPPATDRCDSTYERHRHIRAQAARADGRDDAGACSPAASSRSEVSTSRPIPIRCRRWSTSSPRAPASRPRRSSATSPSRSRSRWRAFPMSPPSAPSRCSACPT